MITNSPNLLEILNLQKDCDVKCIKGIHAKGKVFCYMYHAISIKAKKIEIDLFLFFFVL
uniref:Uncharacterized protein n=1 Tax=Rhizophagus irregularis (strain DAOM 181602 / DAOM 197198 / MUCL 43194) TaxID=747089 RepID=U9STF9_RHIID